MGAPRKNPPPNALADIDRLAQIGYSTTGLARFFKVSRRVILRWFEENDIFEETFEQGIDVYRQSIEEKIIAYTAAGKPCAGLIFLMKSRFKYYDIPNNATKVDVNVAVAQPVLIIKDHGSNDEWAAKALAQQQALTAPEARISLPINKPDTALPWIEGNISSDDDEVDEEASDTVPTKMLDVPSWRGNA
ncbi:MAG TPA: hypothetical protein VHZ28_13570 [Terracidiphilus sp.]|nr:hypothetical protein [Terracidiphilus sp.]